MKNVIYESFSKDKFNKEINYNKIMTKAKKTENSKKYKLVNIAAVIVTIVLLGSVSPWVYAEIKSNIEFKNFQNREYKMSLIDIKDVTEKGLIEKIDMDYITQDKVGVKLDSLYVTGNHLEIKADFMFPKDKNVDSENFNFGYAIYDENKNIYGILPRLHGDSYTENFKNYPKMLYKEIGMKFNKHDLYKGELYTYSTALNIYAENYNIISKIIMDTSDNFPQSKKLFIRIFDLGSCVFDENNHRTNEDLKISDAEWIFEINIPDRFYENNNVELKLKDEIEGITINRIYVDDIKLRVDADIDSIYGDDGLKLTSKEFWNIITITDETVNKYEQINGSGDNNNVVIDFAINKNMLDKKYFLNINIKDKVYVSELVMK